MALIQTKSIPRTEVGECEACDKTKVKVSWRHGSMWLCDECWAKEETLMKENKTNETIVTAEKIDQSLHVKSDLFNAETVAIVELKAAIDHDENIPNKRVKLGEVVKGRILTHRELLAASRQQVIDLESKIRAGQQYLNQLAAQLHESERAALNLQDLEYPVKAPKVVKPKAVKTPSKKVTKADARLWAIKYGVADIPDIELAIIMAATAQNKSAEEAAKSLAEKMGRVK
jgi:hypothetical protein